MHNWFAQWLHNGLQIAQWLHNGGGLRRRNPPVHCAIVQIGWADGLVNGSAARSAEFTPVCAGA